jgi:ankyrin repeat protein
MLENKTVDANEQLWQAAWTGNTASLDRLLASGVDVDATPEAHTWPALGAAVEQMNIEAARRLIQGGADVNQELNGWSPLTHAIEIESDSSWQAHYEPGHESVALTELLLSYGATPTERAFEVARKYDNRKALTLLQEFLGRT